MADWQRGWRGIEYRYYPNPQAGYYPPPTPAYKPYVKPPVKPKKVHKMITSVVHWCEYGGTENGHAFSSKDPNKERIVRSKETGKVDPYQNPIVEDEEFYLCGKHANGLFRSTTETDAKEIRGTVVD